MDLILAEKPSAARNFAKALGGKTGNYAGTEYKITNLRGHVMGLLPPDKQVPTEKVEFYKSWDLENLPWNLNDFGKPGTNSESPTFEISAFTTLLEYPPNVLLQSQ